MISPIIHLSASLRLHKLTRYLIKKKKQGNVTLTTIKFANRSSKQKYLKHYANLAKSLFPNNSFGYIGLAEYYMDQGDNKKASESLVGATASKTLRTLKKKLNKLGYNVDTAFPTETSAQYNDIDAIQFSNPNQIEDMFKFSKSKFTRLISKFPDRLLQSPTAYIAKARSSSERGNFRESLSILMLAQRKFPGERRILFSISELFKNDKQIARAYSYMLAGETTYPVYGAVKRLSFEVDAKLLDEGQETLSRVLDFELDQLVRFISIINRVSVFLTDEENKLVRLRLELQSYIAKTDLKGEKEYNKYIQLALINRWHAEAETLIKNSEIRGYALTDHTQTWFNKVDNLINIGSDPEKQPVLDWLKLAIHNESDNSLMGWVGGLVVEIDDEVCSEIPTVELFIPNALFSDPEQEKPTFQTVAKVYRELFIKLIEEDILVIPRHQYNWRYCKPKTEHTVISYHTINEAAETNRLHIQESVFSGYCSLDTSGFAGFSSVAKDHSKISDFCSTVSADALSKHRDELYSKYVEKNISKYSQVEERAAIEGDYVFVALQVFTDPVAELAYIDGVNLLRTVAHYHAKTGVKVVVKRHPYCNSMTVQRETELLLESGLIELSNASVHSLIGSAQAVFAVNSGVGLEALIHLKPVVITGYSEYTYGAFAFAKSDGELKTVLDNGFEDVDTAKMLEFLYFYNNSYIGNEETLPSICVSAIKNKESS